MGSGSSRLHKQTEKNTVWFNILWLSQGSMDGVAYLFSLQLDNRGLNNQAFLEAMGNASTI